jgi:hypothetical protein
MIVRLWMFSGHPSPRSILPVLHASDDRFLHFATIHDCEKLVLANRSKGSIARILCTAMALPVYPKNRTSPSAGPMSQMGQLLPCPLLVVLQCVNVEKITKPTFSSSLSFHP